MPLHLVCPQCGTVNRLPEEKFVDHWAAARCSVCRAPLVPGEPIEVGGRELARHLERSDLPVVVDFWAPWCGPCRSMAPNYAAAAAQLAPVARFLKLDTEADPQAGAAFAIRAIPTMVVFKGGREVGRQSGALTTQQIVGWVRRAAA